MYSGKFEAPGPGSWELEQTHMVRPVSRWCAAVFLEPHMRGFGEGLARYGALIENLDVALVNGFMYGRLRPVGAPPGAKGPPPKLIFKLLLLLHPEIRRRLKRARRVWETKLWREDVERWDRDWKPECIARNRALQAVDPAALDDAGLAAHLEAIRSWAVEATYRHHALNVPCILPVGDFLVHAHEWTGKPVSDLLTLTRGASPVSNGAIEEIDRLVAAIRQDDEAEARLRSDDDPGRVIAALSEWGGAVGAAMRAYLDVVALQLLSGYDVADQSAIETPIVLLRNIRSTLERKSAPVDPAAEVTARIAAVREAVPSAHRAEFDALLEEVRFVFRVRDEKGNLNDRWTFGIARRALLEAGRRLAARGRIARPDHAVEFAPDELRAVLTGGEGPTRDELAAYDEWRRTKTIADAPAILGPEPGAPPPAEWLPPAAARMTRAVMTAVEAMFEVAKRKSSETETVRGLAASPGRVEGTARLVLQPDQFAKVEQGDVLIAATTCPTYNVLLPILGGIVTDRGGLLSHAAIVAREYGLPAVVGTTNATRAIPDGARVRVDGATGTVELLR